MTGTSSATFEPAILNGVAEGDGEVLVMLHPVGLDLGTWDAVAPGLRGRRLVRLDLRGHGSSPAATAGMDLADYAADVKQTLAAMGISRASMMGLSMGGMVAQEFAIANPEFVDRLVVAACPCTLPVEARGVLGRRGVPALAGGMSAIERETMERWFTPGFLDSGQAEMTRRTLLGADPKAWSTAWEAIGRLDTKPRLGRVNARTLCIAGALDPASPPAALRLIADHIEDARFLAIDDAPHMMQVETPQRLAQIVDAFLREGDAS